MTDEERRARQRIYNAKWMSKPGVRERMNANTRRRRKGRPTPASHREWCRRNPDRVRANDARKYLKRRNVIRAERLGASVAEVEKWLAIGRCEACGAGFAAGDGYIDHDHATGKIRGLLCRFCNLALGTVLESPERLEGLARYARERCVVPQVVEAVLRAMLEQER